MSQNLRLVKYFTSEFYFSHTIELAHIASTTFEFSINSGPKMGYEEFASRRALFTKDAKLELGDFTSADDLCFIANFKSELKNGQLISGKCIAEVARGLLERVEIKYDMTDGELQELEQVLLQEN